MLKFLDPGNLICMRIESFMHSHSVSKVFQGVPQVLRRHSGTSCLFQGRFVLLVQVLKDVPTNSSTSSQLVPRLIVVSDDVPSATLLSMVSFSAVRGCCFQCTVTVSSENSVPLVTVSKTFSNVPV